MASIARHAPTRRPSCSLQYLRPTSTRHLTTSQSRKAVAGTSLNMMRNLPKQKALNSRMKNLKRSEIPNDIGIIPNTYVRACGKLPSWFSEPRIRAQLEWYYFRQTASDFINFVYHNRWSLPTDPLTNRRKKLPLNLRDRYTIARDLHTRLNTALAEGDRTTISKIACSGLANEQTGRLDRARASNEPTQTWTVKYRGATLSPRLYHTVQLLIPSYFKAIHVVADRAMQLPAGPGLQIRQIILRIDSTQTLEKHDGSSPVTRDMREYFVMQKTLSLGEEADDEEGGEWMVWGTENPTTTETALEIMSATKSETGTMMDRIRAVFPGMGGMGGASGL